MKEEEEQNLFQVEELLREVAAGDRRRAEQRMASSDGRFENMLREAMYRPARRGLRLYRVLSAAASLAVMGGAGAMLFQQYGNTDSSYQASQSVEESIQKGEPLPVSLPEPCSLEGPEDAVQICDVGSNAAMESVPEKNFTLSPGSGMIPEPQAIESCGAGGAQQPAVASLDCRELNTLPDSVRCGTPVAGKARGVPNKVNHFPPEKLARLLLREKKPYRVLRLWFERPGADKCVEVPGGVRVEYHEGLILVIHGAERCELRSTEDTLPENILHRISSEKKLEK